MWWPVGLAEASREGAAPDPAPAPEARSAPVPPLSRRIPVDPMAIRRWPVQILSASYGTGGKKADVTARVKEHVERLRQTFSANPGDLGADPNPGWNKGLHIIYMKDGVRREQRRNENETVLPESFYGPQDAAEFKAWLPASRWAGEKAELQFHADQTFTWQGSKEVGYWEITAARKARLTWPGEDWQEFQFDYVWTSFSKVGDPKTVYQLVR